MQRITSGLPIIRADRLCRDQHLRRRRTVYTASYRAADVRFTSHLRWEGQVIERKMTLWQRWVQRPQSLRIRKVLVQVHLWVGLGIGLYVLVISISGSAIIYRRELMRRPLRRTVIVAESGQRMSVEELVQQAQRAYPTYEVANIRQA